MKLFKLKTSGLRPVYYIAAHTNVEALATLFMDCEMTFDDLDYEDQIVEIPQSEWNGIIICRMNEKQTTAAQDMKGRKYTEVIYVELQED